MLRYVSIALAVLVACGGGGKKEETVASGDGEEGGGMDTGEEGEEDPCAGGMCPPEKLEQIEASLNRKTAAATRCLTDAIDDDRLPKTTSGEVTLEFVIQPDGSAADIAVARSDIKDEGVQQCWVEMISKMTFPDVPRALPWSKTYAFEGG
jgi:hypothetical protein